MQKYLRDWKRRPIFAIGFKKESQLKHNLQTLKNFSIMAHTKKIWAVRVSKWNANNDAEFLNIISGFYSSKKKALKFLETIAIARMGNDIQRDFSMKNNEKISFTTGNCERYTYSINKQLIF